MPLTSTSTASSEVMDRKYVLIQFLVRLMIHRNDHGIIIILRIFGQPETVFMLQFLAVGIWIDRIHRHPVCLNSLTRSATLEFRMSLTFSLKVTPMTRTFA